MEQLYQRFFHALPIRSVHTDEEVHLLSPEELHLVRRTEYWALAAAVLIELAAYLAIFLPIYEFPDFFESRALRIGGPFLQITGSVHWVRDAWMLAVTLVELYVLLLLNLAAVHGIAVATGYIKRDTKAAHASGLIRIALEKRFAAQREYGIDPFEGMNPWLLYAFLLFNRLKGLIGSAVVRAVLSNVFGREILRVYLDFSGMPIYMAINMYTTHVILRNARVVVMGQTSIEIIRRQFPKPTLSPEEKGLIYDTLQFIAVSKRDFHANHFYLTRAVIDHFAIPVEPAHPLPEGYQEKLKSTRQAVADICRLVIVLGFLLDGRLSRRERRQLGRLRQQGVLDVAYADLETYRRSFVDGQGLGEVTARFLDHRRAVSTDHP
jgi:hypothetical protein